MKDPKTIAILIKSEGIYDHSFPEIEKHLDKENVCFFVDIATGTIKAWHLMRKGYIHAKVVDEGSYVVFDKNHKKVCGLKNECVPHEVIPGRYGDYIDLEIENGIITNWPKNPDFSNFEKL
tara:strand:+ start:70321 stop:70683 length:363 start_codon:yes stop_codon:yes gene_type:complete